MKMCFPDSLLICYILMVMIFYISYTIFSNVSGDRRHDNEDIAAISIFKRLYLFIFRDRGREKERERNSNM